MEVMIELAILVAAVCVLALILGPRPRPVRDPYQEAERWGRIASVALIVSAVGCAFALLALLALLVELVSA